MYRFFLPAAALCVLISFLCGAVYGARVFQPALSLTVAPDTSPPAVPVVRIDGIRNGALVGSVSGNVRLAARDRIVPTSPDGAFSVTDGKLLTNIIEITIPDGMRFVASKRGKKYYPIGSASANGLTPVNRIYFSSAEEAEKAGYAR